MSFILALDQGTSSSRAILFNEKGEVVTSAQKNTTLLYPNHGWVEQDPAEIIATQYEVMQNAISSVSADLNDVLSIGITNQRETVIAWNKTTGKAFYNAIIWQDARTSEFCKNLPDQNTIQKKTGLVVHPYFSASKMHWLMHHVPEIRRAADENNLCFGTVDTWLIYNLTNRESFVTDHTNASRTMLYNIYTADWDDYLLSVFSIPKTTLAKIQNSSSEFGVCRAVVPHCKITGVAGDQHAALFGQCCFSPGMIKNTYGTGCFLLMNTGNNAVPSSHKLLTTLSFDRQSYALEGSVFIGGAVIAWLRDQLKIIKSSSEVEKLAMQVKDSDGVYFVPAFSGLGAPYWDTEARGIITGITGSTSSAHIARAAVESLALQTADVIQAMVKDSGIALKEIRVDGGAALNDLLLQFQADILDIPVVRPRVVESTARGAAFLAGLSVKLWTSESELNSLWIKEKEFFPQINVTTRTEILSGWSKAIQKARL